MNLWRGGYYEEGISQHTAAFVPLPELIGVFLYYVVLSIMGNKVWPHCALLIDVLYDLSSPLNSSPVSRTSETVVNQRSQLSFWRKYDYRTTTVRQYGFHRASIKRCMRSELVFRMESVTNRRAIGLYVKYGFQVYGTRPHGIKYPDGSYADDYLMRKVLWCW